EVQPLTLPGGLGWRGQGRLAAFEDPLATAGRPAKRGLDRREGARADALAAFQLADGAVADVEDSGEFRAPHVADLDSLAFDVARQACPVTAHTSTLHEEI